MKKVFFICLLLAGVVVCSSCSSRRSAINDLESLVERVEKNGEGYTLADWENVIYRCAEIEKKLQKHEYTTEEHREIGELKGRLAANMTADIIAKAVKKAVRIKEQMNGGVAGFLINFFKAGSRD